jgi:hypothetical protein
MSRFQNWSSHNGLFLASSIVDQRLDIFYDVFSTSSNLDLVTLLMNINRRNAISAIYYR